MDPEGISDVRFFFLQNLSDYWGDSDTGKSFRLLWLLVLREHSKSRQPTGSVSRSGTT